MFKDRKEAGIKLGKRLKRYRNENIIVLAIPKGGVEVGYEVAKYLQASVFSLLITRKLPYPSNPESGFGAIAEDGSYFIFNRVYKILSEGKINSIRKKQVQEIKRRIHVLRNDRPLPELNNEKIILVDDGIAMGSTMEASIKLCKNKKPGKIIVAVPVSGKSTKHQIEKKVDEIEVLETPRFFRAVAQVYEKWYDVSDKEVIQIMKKWNKG